ncbi:hypothetical protein O4160_08870 [Rhodococcus sp. IEGM 1401]|uniref:hypothetical protein n=1 Tax=unclassified Rhodococcus (in: high G+C Gram-positive bacteria) TaxID=192944 RepID=UPI0022B49015|nr:MULTISPECIES: hypothetical protein [unclassified Rhodococcus (in: high G+C Gram-positive bacteria)]MCZ4560952.1 hypothetical protein [Rhodococcus sp. IEGM 1401]MDI9921142.1 hypothetical protein [Rhodococcus sp. IEGM 1372]MDV8033595.1 hypothetical protein [Rhodococcus sp. IEGM 1414]
MPTPSFDDSSAPGSERAEPRRIRPQDGEFGRADDPSPTPRIALAVALALIAAVAAVAAQLIGVVRSADGSPVGTGAVVAAILAGAVPVVVVLGAVVGVVGKRVEFAAALLAGYGAVALGLTLLDVALLSDPIDANRLELFRPLSAAMLDATAGAYVLLVGHAVSVLAGVAGWSAVHRAGLGDGYGHSVYSEHVGRAAAGRVGPLLAALLGAFGVLAAVAAFASLYRSSDPVVIVTAVVESPVFVAVGSGVVGIAALVVAASALASLSPQVASGASVGAGLGVLGFAGVGLLAGLSTGARVDAGLGAYLGTLAGLGLLICGAVLAPVAAARDRRALERAQQRESGARGVRGVAGLGATRWHAAAGSIGVLAGVLFVVGSLLPILETDSGIAVPQILATRVVMVAGFVMILGSVPLLFSEFASAARPFVSMFWLGAVAAAAGVLQSVVLAEDVDGVGAGIGALAIIAGVVAAAATGLLALFAGSAERDDVDTSADASTDGVVLGTGLFGAVLLAVGLALPLYRGSDFTAATVTEFPWGWDTWGQMLLAVGVVVAAVVAARARAARGSVLLGGAAVAGIVHLASWPLTSARATDPEMGPAVLPVVAGIVVLGVAAALSARRADR